MLIRSLVHSFAACGLVLTGLAIQGHSQESPGSDAGTDLAGQNVDEPESAPPRIDEPKFAAPRITVYYLRNQPAEMVANTLALAMVNKSGLTIVPDRRANALFVNGTEEALKECETILEAIDQPRKLIHFDVVIGVVDSETTADDKNKPGSIDRIQFATLDENQASFQCEQQVAVLSGTVAKGLGQGPPTKTYQLQKVGTICQVVPRIAGDEISVNLEIEKSWLVQPAGGDDMDDAIPAINTARVQSTVSLKPGVAYTVLKKVSQGPNAAENVSITITATLEPPKDH